MNETGFETPEEAAMQGWDRRYARVVAVRELKRDYLEGEWVEVELATNEEPRAYPYFVNVQRRDGRWFEGLSHN